ncbi:hypothetical protein LTR02_007378 [Friedmanniomyces endolithicus]|nr:hypothetical protein LTR59_014981 [Friedmanniomyces endolithicus]KAK0863819.1 hypothetical protein LTS02_006377 [Friedmanniomyces endolithicus]KAK0903842.1 hypothetical protein LTR02_007378 [Friedmanniomyces endolithicus]KAK0924533.1 hypothetical protein LTR57_005757 [Friedmanniomyces endolithicus]KAK0970739.1 hypothetical protein LTS01_015675 [Friedmanniomyces endolithicus]
MVTVNEATNKTQSTTVYNEEYTTDGGTTILTRTDTNAAGTVTQDLGTATLAYPTPYFTLGAELVWNAILPQNSTAGTGTGSCCGYVVTTSPTPTHAPFTKTGSTNTADPSGWLYTLVGFNYGDALEELGPSALTSLWGGQSLTFPYTACSYTICGPYSTSSMLAASTVGSCGFYQSSGSAVEGNVKCPGRGCDQLAIVNAQSHVLSSAAATNFHPVSLQRGFCQLIGSQHATFNRRPHVFPSGVKTILYPDGLQYALCSSEHTIISRSILLQSLSAAAIHYPDNSITVNPGFFGIKCSFYGSSEHWVTLKCIASDLVKSTRTTDWCGLKPPPVAVASTTSTAVTFLSGSTTAQVANSIQSSGSAVVVVAQSAAPGSTTTAGSVVVVAGQSSALGSTISVGSGEGTTATAVHGSSLGTLLASGSPAATLPSTSPIATAIATKSSSAIVFGGITASPVVMASTSTAESGSSVQGHSTALTSATQYVVGGQTLTPGSSITVGSGSATTIVALPTDASQTYLVVGSSTSIVQQQSAVSSAIVFAGVTASPKPVAATIAGSNPNTVLPDSSNTAGLATQYVVAGQTLVPGSSITVGSGEATTVVALRTGSSNTLLIVGSSTSTIGQTPSTPPALIIGSSVIAANSNSQYVVAGQTLVPGSTITVGSGGATTVVALQTDSSKTVLVVGSSKSTIGQQQITAAPPALTIGSSVISANSKSQYLVGSQTLVPGGSAITVSGTVISLATGATEVMVGTQSEVVATGLGGYIWSGLGAGPTASTSAMGSRSGSSSPGTTSPGSTSLGGASPGSVTSSVGGAIPKSAGVHSFTASGIITIMVAGLLLALLVVL